MANEKTSARVASKAGMLLSRFDRLVAEIKKLRQDIKSVAGSALTQAPNRRK